MWLAVTRTHVFEGSSTTTTDLNQFKSAELEDSIELLLSTSLTSSMDYSVTDPNSGQVKRGNINAMRMIPNSYARKMG